jgi:ArsR family metal-binding transcriptional regulator
MSDIIITIGTQGQETIHYNKDDTDSIELIYEITEVYNNAKQKTQRN